MCLGIAGAPICRPSLQAPLPGAQLWESPEPWDADMVNVRAETAWLCLSPGVNASQWAAREPGHVLQPKYWSGQQLTLSADTGRELQLMLMYREKVTFAMSFPSVSASAFYLLLGCRQSFV